MQLALMTAVSIHLLAGVFWAGTSFAVARTGGLGGERLFAPQIIAALLAVLSGAYLWKALHEGSFGPMERILGLGAVSAIFALLVQLALIRPALRALRESAAHDARRRLMAGNRAVAALLALAALAMAAARYA